MTLAEYCDTSPGYIAEIEAGRKFPSPEMIDKLAQALRIDPYLFFINQKGISSDNRNTPQLPYTVKKQIKAKIKSAIRKQVKTQVTSQINAQVNLSMKEVFSEINKILDNC